MQESHGQHHAHIRKRIHQKHEKYPHPNKTKRFMDKAIYVVGVFGPVMTVPQLIKIYVEKTTAGISLITWVAYLIVALFWLTYGVMHKEKPIIFTNILWISINIPIIVGTLLY